MQDVTQVETAVYLVDLDQLKAIYANDSQELYQKSAEELCWKRRFLVVKVQNRGAEAVCGCLKVAEKGDNRRPHQIHVFRLNPYMSRPDYFVLPGKSCSASFIPPKFTVEWIHLKKIAEEGT